MGFSVPGNSCVNCSSPNMINGGCTQRVATKCVYYSGANIVHPVITTGQTLDQIINALATSTVILPPTTLVGTLVQGLLEYTDNGTIGHLYFTLNQSGTLTRVQII